MSDTLEYRLAEEARAFREMAATASLLSSAVIEPRARTRLNALSERYDRFAREAEEAIRERCQA